ncbi:MAG: RAD55 family ATPase [Vicinamibacteria bacterium]
MSGRLSSGHPRLDSVLGGGLPENAITLLLGLPGSGKTILAQQYVFANATPERPAIYLSTVSEPLEKIIRYGQTLDFFAPEAVGHSVFYEDLGSLLNDRDLPGIVERVGRLMKERRPGMIVIDSFKALSGYAGGGDFRRFLHELAGYMSVFPASCFWVGEYAEEEIAEAPEFAVADAIIALSTARAAERETRVLRILKLRGTHFSAGAHAYRITAGGIDVFPRLADAPDFAAYELGDSRISSGIAALDEMLADGYWPGASTLCAGPSGSGKTLMGLHFIFNGARQGEPGVIAALQENPVQLERIVNGFGWSLEEERIELMYRSPVDMYVDEWVYEVLETVDRTGARRVLIDSLSDLEFASPDPIRFREYMYSLTQRFAREGVSLFMTSELPDLFQVTRLSEFGVSHVADNVVVLQYVRDESAVRRALTVLKTRASRHEPEIREFRITPDGIVLGEALASAQSFG